MKAPPFCDPNVEAVFAGYPANLREPLLALRGLILHTARETPGVGEVVETLKWGEPAYLPRKPRVGTTIRISRVKGSDTSYAAYFHCRTTLLDDFRNLYPDSFIFDGNRALIFSVDAPPSVEELRHCIAMAFTYHLARRS